MMNKQKVGAVLLCAATGLVGTSASAAIVKVAASGSLSQASGKAHVGDAFSISTSYDDAVIGKPYLSSSYIFSAPAAISFTINGTSYVDDVMTSMIYDPATSQLHFAAPADYSGPRAFLTLTVPHGSDGSVLPGSSDLAGMSGTFRFEILGNPAYAASGMGSFVDAVPETATWAMMIAGVCVVGYTLRQTRRRAATTA